MSPVANSVDTANQLQQASERHPKRLVALVVVGLLLVVGAIYLYLSYHRAERGRLDLVSAELSYLTTLKEILDKQPHPESQTSVAAFISAASINSVLSGADAISIPLSRGANVKIESIHADFADGFPGFAAKAQFTSDQPKLDFRATIYGVLEPKIDEAEPANLLFFVHPLYVDVGDTARNTSDAARPAANFLGIMANQYSSLLPHLSVPLSHDFVLSFPPNRQPIDVPTGAGKLHGEIDLPGLNVRSQLFISGALFLSDGVHVLANASANLQKAPSPTVLPYHLEKPSGIPPARKAVAKAIEERERQIEALRKELQPALANLKVADSDFRIFVSKSLISSVGDTFNSLSPAERKVHYHTLSEEGQLYKTGGGGLGCGGYANLSGGNSANADAQLSKLTTTWSAQGVNAALDVQFSFDAQVTGHVNGPAGPHATSVLNCVNIFGKDFCTNLPSTTISCDSPIGGGVGLGSYGVSGNRTERIAAAMNIHQDQSNWLMYDVALTSPADIPITVSVGLGQLGTLGIPFTFPVPHQTLISGTAPNLFSASGTLQDSSINLQKTYSLQISPTAGKLSDDGYAAEGKLAIAWK